MIEWIIAKYGSWVAYFSQCAEHRPRVIWPFKKHTDSIVLNVTIMSRRSSFVSHESHEIIVYPTELFGGRRKETAAPQWEKAIRFPPGRQVRMTRPPCLFFPACFWPFRINSLGMAWHCVASCCCCCSLFSVSHLSVPPVRQVASPPDRTVSIGARESAAPFSFPPVSRWENELLPVA